MIAAGLLASIVLVVVVGLWASRRIDGDSTNFFVAGRNLSVPLTGAALMGSAVDSNATLGNTDLAASFGFWAGFSLPAGLALCLVLTGLFVAKPMNRMGLLTLPDFYRRTYGRGVEVTASLLLMFGFCILLAGNLVAGGFLLEHFFGLDYTLAVIAVVLVVLVYTVTGGMVSSAYTAAAQMAISVAAALALLVWVAAEFGLSAPTGAGPLDLGQLTSSESGATINWATLIALGIGDIVAIDFMQRIFSAKSPEAARRACFLGAAGTLVVGVPFSLVALASVSILGDRVAEGPVLLTLLSDYAPAGLAMLVLAGIISASFSTASGAILGTAGVAVRNVWGVRQVTIGGGSDTLLRATRMATLPVVVVAVFFAVRVPQTGILLTLAFDLLLAGLVVPFLLGLFWSRATAPAAVAALVLGTTVRLVLFAVTPTIYGVENTLLYVPNGVVGAGFDGWPTFLAALVSLTAFVVTALATRPDHEARAERVTALEVELAPPPAAAPTAAPTAAPLPAPRSEPAAV